MSLFKKPQVTVPTIITPPAGVTQEEVLTPTPVPTAETPAVIAAKRRNQRQERARQGQSSTILTSAMGLGSTAKTTPPGATLLGG